VKIDQEAGPQGELTGGSLKTEWREKKEEALWQTKPFHGMFHQQTEKVAVINKSN